MTDIRVEKTYQALMNAFTQLMEETRYEDITIAALCDRALIRRTTFYKHFANKDEFLDFFMLTIRDDLKAHLASSASTTEPEQLRGFEARMMNQLASFLLSHEKLIDSVLASASADTFLNTLQGVIALDVQKRLEDRSAAAQPPIASPEMVAAFLSGGITSGVRRWWLAGHTEEGRQELVSLTLRMCSVV